MTSKLTLLSLLMSLITFNLSAQNSLHFDGTNDEINCGNNSSVQITSNKITLEAWIYPTSWKSTVWAGNIINKEANQVGYMLRAGATGQLNFNIGSGVWNELTSPANALTLNVWQHVAGTYDGSYMRIYVNGILIDSMARTITISNTTSNLFIGEGGFYTGRNFPGRIDEVRVWDTVRTKSLLNATMNKELCSIPSSLKAYYTFNSGTASGTNTGINTLTDLSGNGNNGTLLGFALTGSTSNWIAGKTLTPGIRTSSIAISTCGSYTMPNGTVVTSSGAYYDTATSSSGCDSIITYNITFSSAHISNTISDSACQSYTMPNGTVVTASGTYYDTISSGGCDTLDRYVVTVSGSVNDSIFRVGAKITSWDTWADHQWIKCDSGYAALPGATRKDYTATRAGTYAVIVTRGSCVDTSDCVNISLTSLIHNSNTNIISIFPNPTSDLVSISSNSPIKSIHLIDLTGKIVLSSINSSKLDLSVLPKGVYFAEIKTSNGTLTKKIIKN